jgi:hypothetical protein
MLGASGPYAETRPWGMTDMKVEKELGHVSKITQYMAMKNPQGRKFQSIMRSR